MFSTVLENLSESAWSSGFFSSQLCAAFSVLLFSRGMMKTHIGVEKAIKIIYQQQQKKSAHTHNLNDDLRE